jgi:hypothetical protein
MHALLLLQTSSAITDINHFLVVYSTGVANKKKKLKAEVH